MVKCLYSCESFLRAVILWQGVEANAPCETRARDQDNQKKTGSHFCRARLMGVGSRKINVYLLASVAWNYEMRARPLYSELSQGNVSISAYRAEVKHSQLRWVWGTMASLIQDLIQCCGTRLVNKLRMVSAQFEIWKLQNLNPNVVLVKVHFLLTVCTARTLNAVEIRNICRMSSQLIIVVEHYTASQTWGLLHVSQKYTILTSSLTTFHLNSIRVYVHMSKPPPSLQ